MLLSLSSKYSILFDPGKHLLEGMKRRIQIAELGSVIPGKEEKNTEKWVRKAEISVI